MSSKHTPGPWKWSGEYTHPCGKPAWTLLGRHGLYGILTCDQGSAPQDLNDEANARLIAAAPDLLEALERIARPHDCGCVPCTGQCRSQIALEIAVEEMQELARAAIAKATGEAACAS